MWGNRMDYASKIKQLREVLFLTQEDLAKRLGTSTISISRWERGEHEPTMKMKKELHLLFIEANIISDIKRGE